MNMKTLTFILIIGSSLNAFAQEIDCSSEENASAPQCKTPAPSVPAGGNQQQQVDPTAILTSAMSSNRMDVPTKCDNILRADEMMKAKTPPVTQTPQQKYAVHECVVFRELSEGKIIKNATKDDQKVSADGKITCKKKASYTADYDECERALNFYSGVVVAETAMNVEQKVRTDLKNQSIAKKSQQEMASGASQTAMFDAAAESNNHQKSMQQEKAIAYSAAVAALVNAYRMIPGIDKIQSKYCPGIPGEAKSSCQTVMKSNKGTIAANDGAKSALLAAIMDFTAKGLAAGIAMGQYGNAAKQIEQAKNSINDESTDLMMEKCVLNPTDPSCAKSRTRTPTDTIAQGDFGFSGGEGNSFNMTPDSSVAPEMGAETNLDENAPVAGVNTPFANDAKIAKGILDPAAGAQMQATGGAQGGGGGGGSGGGGGGGASLGSDLNGANKDGDKEAQVKTNKVAGAYSQGSGGGYKGVGKSKDDANPFASLFDAKGSGGGVEEDRSIASGDIDGAASGLFQKISKRYGQVQADKRIEAKNLE